MVWTDEIIKASAKIDAEKKATESWRIERDQNIGPIIMRILNELGSTLWGRGLFGAKYYTSFYSGSWYLSNKFRVTSSDDTDYGICIKVSVFDNNYFEVCTYNPFNKIQSNKQFSEEELKNCW
ncbi:hypothetical protein KP003_14275 [Geomonas nitrogeniifigens]|uniref:hypothetical protein n=1 Tax=Geomonas diazotrophica TaxID=2843197 RepID=UPI001C2BB004|nr:hypothetical protein [Geomonas nitrogeniifigens]QXE85543.1 hypothetical protein KP003_14275 [Geomonas nitrogeniifigens]